MKQLKLLLTYVRRLSIVSGMLLLGACHHNGGAEIEAGQQIAIENCARCHAIGRTGESPLAAAPPFGRLHDRYDIGASAEVFAEGIALGHKEMPPFSFYPAQISALLAYLKSLEQNP